MTCLLKKNNISQIHKFEKKRKKKKENKLNKQNKTWLSYTRYSYIYRFREQKSTPGQEIVVRR